MKIKPEHLAELEHKVVMAMLLSESEADYAKRGLSAKRYRWDMLWKTDIDICPWYSYLHDTHIDTALRHIMDKYRGDLTLPSDRRAPRQTHKGPFPDHCYAKPDGPVDGPYPYFA